MATFGEWLRDKRRKAGLSQEELSERADCSKTYISNLERDMPHPVTGKVTVPSKGMVEALARGLGVPVREVVAALYEAGQEPEPEDDDTDLRGIVRESVREAIREELGPELTREPDMDAWQAAIQRMGFHGDLDEFERVMADPGKRRRLEEYVRMLDRTDLGDPRDQG